MDVSLYYRRTLRKGIELTDVFYNASLSVKREASEVLLLELHGHIPPADYHKLYDLIVKAMVQHSGRAVKHNYPIKGERKQRPEAAAADRQESYEALFTNLDRIVRALGPDVSKTYNVQGGIYDTP